MILILVSILSVLCFLHYFFKHIALVKDVEDIPGPAGFPLIGNISDVLLTPDKLFYAARKFARDHKDIYRFWIFQDSIINLIKPDDIEVLLSSRKNISKSRVYNFLHPWLREGLLTSTGDKWQKRRKILTPSFHFSILKQFVDIFEEQSNILVNKLRPECEKDETNIGPFVTEFALNAICETAMGVSLDPSKSSTQSYKKSIHRLGELLVHRLVRPWIHPDFLFNLSASGKEQKSTLNTLHSFTQNVINERKENYVKVVPVSNDEVEVIGKSKQRLAMLDLLLSAHANNDIENSGISEEVDTFMFEGHDTTSMAIIFSLMCLANNPDIQERVYDEIFGIFGTSTRTATIHDLQQMRYLEQCLKETLRLYPSVPFISRTISEPLKLPKYTIPAGLMVHVHIFDLHRDPILYPDPEKFDPERFTAENCVKRHPFAYIPFSAGQRNCIGQKFALLEEKSVVSTILRNYRLEAITRPEDLKFFSDLVLRTTTPIKMKIRPRVIN